jgi:hypothetical protein
MFPRGNLPLSVCPRSASLSPTNTNGTTMTVAIHGDSSRHSRISPFYLYKESRQESPTLSALSKPSPINTTTTTSRAQSLGPVSRLQTIRATPGSVSVSTETQSDQSLSVSVVSKITTLPLQLLRSIEEEDPGTLGK